MSLSYFSFHFTLSAGTAVLEDIFSEVGRAAWTLLDKKLLAWPQRRTHVMDHDIACTVDVLELCDDDVGLEPLPSNPEQFTYGLAVYSEQVGLALTQEHLAAVESMCIAAFTEAAAAAGLTSVGVALSYVEAQTHRTGWGYKTAPSLAALHALDNEACWVTSDGDALTGLHVKRDVAFATGARFVDAFDANGKPVRSYLRRDPPAAERPACFTTADYTTEF